MRVQGSTVDVVGARALQHFSTRRRLIAAFSMVLAAFLVALAFQVFVLRRMEATFAAMEERDQQMQLALQLESAVRDQLAHQGLFAASDAPVQLLEYREARARALRLSDALGEWLIEPEAAARMGEIRIATEELDRVFREQVAPAVRGRDAVASVIQSQQLVSIIEENVDRIFARLQQATGESRRELVRIEETALQLIAALAVTIPVFVVGAVLYLSRSVARPLAKLSEGAAVVAAGDLDARIDIHSPDEFGALASEFNAMTVALKREQERLVKSEKLAAIGRLAAGVAHELNNPLQVILGYLSLNRDVPNPRLAAQLAATEEEAVHCKQIVDNLLELSRPSAESVPVELGWLCEDVAGRLGVTLPRDGPEVSVDGSARALGDRPRLRQVLFNLLKNAMEAAGPAGSVAVRVRASGDRAEVEVSDSGPGIAPEARLRLFEPFFTTKPSGTGLGLAISRATALAQGGDIDARNGESGGAVFTLRLPRAPEGRH
jgi:signal transduction histidine kinase